MRVDGTPHPLFPISIFREYISITSSSSSMKLYLDPIGLSALSIFKLRFLFALYIHVCYWRFLKLQDLK